MFSIMSLVSVLIDIFAKYVHADTKLSKYLRTKDDNNEVNAGDCGCETVSIDWHMSTNRRLVE